VFIRVFSQECMTKHGAADYSAIVLLKGGGRRSDPVIGLSAIASLHKAEGRGSVSANRRLSIAAIRYRFSPIACSINAPSVRACAHVTGSNLTSPLRSAFPR